MDAPDLHLSLREVELLVRTVKSGDEKAMRELADLRKAFEAEGDKHGAARVAITQSKLFIELHKFRKPSKVLVSPSRCSQIKETMTVATSLFTT